MPQESADTRNVVSIGLPDGAPESAGGENSEAKSAGNHINDSGFITDLNRLRSLKSFLNNEAVVLPMSEDDSRALGDLFTLTPSFRGRPPTGVEWSELDRFNQLFFQRLTEAQRRRFLLGGIPQAFARLPFIFVGIAVLSLLASFIIPYFMQNFGHAAAQPNWNRVAVLSCYLFWLISLGALGSIAFIGMNALSVQQDITFDLLNPRLINLRIALGALFALVLTLPFGFDGYIKFLETVLGVPNEKGPPSTFDTSMLIMPFLFGFSTSLVIMILNRLLEAAQSFFGKTIAATTPATPQLPTPAIPQNSAPPRSARSRRRVSEPNSELAAGVAHSPP